MKKILPFIFFLFSFSLMSQSWVQVANTLAIRHHPISFTLNGKGYAVTGTASNNAPTRTVFDYNPQTNSWGQLPNFPGAARSFGIGVVANGFAYIGFGATSTAYLNDLWKFDASDSSWTRLANCGCTGRRHPAMVAIGDRIYVGSGDNASGNLNDWWMYNITTNSWSQVANLPGPNRHHPFMFEAGGAVYAGMGHGGSIYRDWYKLDTATNRWTSMRLFPGQARVAGTQFSANGYGYVLSGDGSNHSYMNTGEMWRYDPTTDRWTQLTAHPGRSRWAPGSFVINNEVYFFGGYNRFANTFPNQTIKFDISPASTGINESAQWAEKLVYPNPADEVLNISSELGATEVRIFDMKGQLIDNRSTQSGQINVSDLNEGLYLMQLYNGTDFLNQAKVLIQ